MNFDQFFSNVAFKTAEVYMCDENEIIECIIHMETISEYNDEGDHYEICSTRGDVVCIPKNTVFEADDEGYRCETGKKIILFSIFQGEKG